MSDEIENKSIFEYSQESYETLFSMFETEMKFKGYSIEEWLVAIKIKPISEDVSMSDLERYTVKISNVTDIILENYSLSKANYTGLRSSIERAMAVSKAFILQDIEAKNRLEATPAKRMKNPTADILETQAYTKNLELHHNLAVSEMFFAFWEAQYKKINLLNQRVTSLNILKNIESKNS